LLLLCSNIVLAAVVAIGVALIGYALGASRLGVKQPGRLAVWGGRIALPAALLEIPVGVSLLMRLPVGAQYRSLGGEFITTTLLACVAITLLWLIHQLAAIALGDVRRGLLARTVAVALLLAVLIATGSRIIRPSGNPATANRKGDHTVVEQRGTS
jgi:hypothetical protein